MAKPDAERRASREALERAEIAADAERRASREAQERAEIAADARRRASRAAHDKQEEDQQEQSQQATRMENLGQLAGGVAHDFNNILAVILNYTAFVSEDLSAPPESDWPERLQSARSDLGQIKQAAEHAASLTRQLLTFARREVTRPQVLNVNDVITAVEEILRLTLGEHIELSTSLCGDLWPILADPGQLEQVLMNLAVNARDAMPGGGMLTIDTENLIVDAESIAGGSKARAGRNVRLRVSDTGTGMAEDTVEHLFEPFFTTKETGTGLGLATVYGILLQAEGSIHVYSHPGMGTTFTIVLPVTQEAAVPITKPVPYQRTPQGETVLVVEDEAALREVTRRIFARNGYHVVTAANGPEALDLARAYPDEIHLLVTDVVMPQMLGKEVAAKMRAIKPGIEVLFISGYARPVLASQGRLDPNVALVDKPFSESELIGRAGQVLNGHFIGFETIENTGTS
jgi:signal transduction histidine kinase